MVLVVGLIVARPLVLGEDPGLLSDQSDPSGLVLTMLWLVAAALWGLWRVWARQDDFRAGLVEAGLGGVVLLVFGTTYGVAAYQHPARLISWEWLAMLLALFLVRQLTVPAEEQHGLLSALLASAVSIAGLGLYQAFYDLPHMGEKYPNVEALRAAYAERGSYFANDDPFLGMLYERLHQDNVYATFAHPNSFAGYLALLLPALVGAAVLSFRSNLAAWQKGLAAAFALSGVAALWCTHSRGALLASTVVGLVVAGIAFRRTLWPHRVAVGTAVVVLAAAAIGVYASGLLNTLLGKQETTAAARGDYWRAAWDMIRERPWFGVGPGNFGRVYPRFMAETAGERIKDPHNFLLEIWATSGIFALGALVAALGAFFVYLLRAGRNYFGWFTLAPAPDAVEPVPALTAAWGTEDLPPLRWSFYLGGMFGMFLGFVLRASYLAKDEILSEGVRAGVQSILWFAAFALFEQILWTPRARALVLGGGAAALLLNLCVSGGIAFPAVAMLLWVVVALALNTVPTTTWPRLEGNLLARYLPLPFLIAVPLIYLFAVLLPVSDSLNTLKKQLKLSSGVADVNSSSNVMKITFDYSYLSKTIIAPLEDSAKTEDTDNAYLDMLLAQLYGQLWSSAIRFPATDASHNPVEVKKKALQFALKAQTYDPQGPDGYVSEYQLRKRFANEYAMKERATVVDRKNPVRLAQDFALGFGSRAPLYDPNTWEKVIWDRTQPAASTSNFAHYKEEYRLAAEVLLRFLPNDPTNPRLHFEIAESFYLAEENKRLADEHAARALAIDERSQHAAHKLTDPQRKNLRQRLAETPAS